jgi:YidC/Oxa1 family membrane protein insertase
VRTYGTRAVTLRAHTKTLREFEKSDATWTCYEGPIGYFNGKLEEVGYKNILEKGQITHRTTGGWFGITDKYWFVSYAPDQNATHEVHFKHFAEGDKDVYTMESYGEAVNIVPSSEISQTQRLFVGAKEIKILDLYEKKLDVKHFDLAIDFGYLYFLTKPLLYALVFVKNLVGNMGMGILLLTLLLKLLLLPLANRSYRSMNRMKEIQPKIQALQKKYASDKMRLGEEISAIYKKEKINPLSGCLPMLLQSPVLFALYKVLYISIEMRHAPFVWWIHDLSQPDPLAIFNLFGLIPIDLPGFLQIGIWPALMGLSMFWQQKIGPAPADPSQASMMLMMPVLLTFMSAQWPSGLVIYWAFSNVLAVGQQYLMMRCGRTKSKSPTSP